MTDDATTQSGTSPETESSEETTQEKGTDYDALIASARKRQAGAEAARQAAEKKARELEQELAKYRSAAQTAQEQELSELAALKARLEQAEQRAAEADAKAAARILDAKYPNARKELPEVTDEVRLAKFEAMLRDDDSEEPPTPKAINAPRSGAGEQKKADVSYDDLVRNFRKIPFPGT
jgi:chromosome segregation ATPase